MSGFAPVAVKAKHVTKLAVALAAMAMLAALAISPPRLADAQDTTPQTHTDESASGSDKIFISNYPPHAATNSVGGLNFTVAQPFTTGPASGGYKVDRFAILARAPGPADGFTLTLHATDTSARNDRPGTALADATGTAVQTSVVHGRVVEWAVELDEPVTLAANTKYYIVFEPKTSGQSVGYGNSNSRTSSSDDGFTVGQPSWQQLGIWTQVSGAYQIQVSSSVIGEFPNDGSTTGVLSVASDSTGSLTYDDEDAFQLSVEPGRRYRIEAEFGDTPSITGGGTIRVHGADNWWDTDGQQGDGYAYIDFGVPAGTSVTATPYHDLQTTLSHAGLVVVRSMSHLANRDRPPHYTGSYTLKLTDITGTIRVRGNTGKVWINADNSWEFRSWGVGKLNSTSNISRAQQFTTGNVTEGFDLDRIEAFVFELESGSAPAAAIHTDSSGSPSSSAHCSLVSPAGFAVDATGGDQGNSAWSRTDSFFAPAAGCVLAGNTKYWVVFSETSSTSGAKFKMSAINGNATDVHRPALPDVWAWDGKAHQRNEDAATPTWSRTGGNTGGAIQFDIIAKPKIDVSPTRVGGV